jgi:hypothetical protein
VLRAVAGRDRVEFGRTAVAVIAIAVAAVALVQLAATRTTNQADAATQAGASEAAKRFATGLTTYDYGHPEVQLSDLRPVVSATVLDQISRSQSDLEKSHATSIGDAGNAWVQSLNAQFARVVVAVSQVSSNSYSQDSRQLSGLIECEVALVAGSWQVDSFRWLQVPAPPTSPAATS